MWNPSTDSALATRYDAHGIGGKTRCRGALQRELGLPVDLEAPIVANVGRIVEQKGTDALVPAIQKLLRATDAQFVVAGDGHGQGRDGEAHGRLRRSRKGRMVFVAAGAGGAARSTGSSRARTSSSSRSRFEPCGLVQLYAQRYGAIPVAHATGGLIDTVVDSDSKLETGTGFLFQAVTTPDIVAAVPSAPSPPGWLMPAPRGPRWYAASAHAPPPGLGAPRARRYEQVYRSLAR